jgi:hypothetical protein
VIKIAGIIRFVPAFYLSLPSCKYIPYRRPAAGKIVSPFVLSGRYCHTPEEIFTEGVCIQLVQIKYLREVDDVIIIRVLSYCYFIMGTCSNTIQALKPCCYPGVKGDVPGIVVVSQFVIPSRLRRERNLNQKCISNKKSIG